MQQSGQPDVLPMGRDEGDKASSWHEPPLRHKPSVAKMTYTGMAYVVSVSNIILSLSFYALKGKEEIINFYVKLDSEVLSSFAKFILTKFLI